MTALKRRFMRPSTFYKGSMLLASVVLVAVSGYIIIRTGAAGTPIAFEPESGTLAGLATQVTDSSASGGQAVKLGTPVNTTVVALGDVQKPRADLHYGLDTFTLAKNQIHPSLAILLGDIQYESGTLSDFQTYFAKTWGTATFPLYPTPGNHDYLTAGATGYYTYFAAGNNTMAGHAVTGPAGQGYYAVDAGPNWRIYSLNSETAGTTAAAQNTWLASDMAANPRPCTIMYYHKPYYDYGTTHDGEGDATLPWMKTFYDHNGDVVLGGHEHNYQRFNPVNPYTDAVDNARGLRSFVIGTGGADNLYATLGATLHKANSLVAATNTTTFGVVKFSLHANSYDWEFVPINTNGYTDSGTGTCH